MRADEEWTRCDRPIPFMFTIASEAWDSLKGTTDAGSLFLFFLPIAQKYGKNRKKRLTGI
ncbi:hypothetical protein [Paenibacillus amylolyticus]|uniref:hypothetical protein n=1 Tax=Paenibacillus amylolyticus TaxID=1451 RepID=UPI0010593521|nr:hypothetical protein [Paenibacillus amylolyticus]